MKLAFHATAYDAVSSGSRARACGLAGALLRAGHEVVWLSPAGLVMAPYVEREHGGALPRGRWREIATPLDPQRPFQRLVRAGRTLERLVPADCDLFVTDYYPVLDAVPTAVTVHDLRYVVASEGESRARALWFRTAYPALARSAALVVTPTQAVAADVRAHLGVDAARVAVVPNALGVAWRSARPASATPTCLLMIGAADRRKDAATAFAALRRAAARGRVLPLVVASRRSRTLDAELSRADDLVRSGLVRLVEAPDDDALVSLARDAAALVHPSRYEGFGMTVIEAMAVGLPVLAARCAAVEEVSGGHARLLPAGDVEVWARAISDACSRSARDDGRSAARIAHARSFGWDRAGTLLSSSLFAALPRKGTSAKRK